MDELMMQVIAALRGVWRRRWIGLAVAWAVAIVGAVGSMVSLGYYLRVVTVTWAPEPEGGIRKVLAVPGPVGLATVTSGLGVIVLAIMASPLLEACRGAAEALLAP